MLEPVSSIKLSDIGGYIDDFVIVHMDGDICAKRLVRVDGVFAYFDDGCFCTIPDHVFSPLWVREFANEIFEENAKGLTADFL